jgi:hypothetical protein
MFKRLSTSCLPVIPAKAGIQKKLGFSRKPFVLSDGVRCGNHGLVLSRKAYWVRQLSWIPAFAGMTGKSAGTAFFVRPKAGMTGFVRR